MSRSRDPGPRILVHRLVPGTQPPRRAARYLVERLWPRGWRREELALDGWLKQAAPTHALRRWFGDRLERWMEYRDEVAAELEERPDTWRALREAARQGPVVLLHCAADPDHNHAVVLRDVLRAALAG